MAINQAAANGRTMSTVFHLSDNRVNNLRRRSKKSDQIALYNIDCMMLFRVDIATIQFDTVNNNRPSILFKGKAEGVYLPPATGLLFPNMCDELDFREDYPVDAQISYELSDPEISTLAANGLFNYDWACQGRVIGAILEIPCTVDYFAIANTPITYIDIQDRLSMRTSTRKTGYKTLVATFLPYSAQKHNAEQYPKLLKGFEYDRDNSSIRKRSLYDSKAVGFMPEFADPETNITSFVETAQARISKKLEDQMSKANILGTSAEKTSQEIAAAVDIIKNQADKARSQALTEAGGDAERVDTATLDARLNDMKTRMAYQGAEDIAVDPAKLKEDALILQKKQPDANDPRMTTPITETTLTAENIIAANEKAKATIDNEKAEAIKKAAEEANKIADEIEAKGENIRAGVAGSAKTAADAAQAITSRKDKLALRRQQAAQAEQARKAAEEKLIRAGQEELSKGLTEREPDRPAPDARKIAADAARGLTQAAAAAQEHMIPDDDILADLYKK